MLPRIHRLLNRAIATPNLLPLMFLLSTRLNLGFNWKPLNFLKFPPTLRMPLSYHYSFSSRCRHPYLVGNGTFIDSSSQPTRTSTDFANATSANSRNSTLRGHRR
ncbi:hypothetical protein B0T10DRAFT_476155 [Thelonectria olida]|uniref:Uncharacterized protein n=1 Tax=Thelonectria olida TaxID=1576542 RepID=A0A9P9AVI4_9HYPO|nr:hypothetical protein B0T10DRAFT_476155 [Thelonectria olida]